MLYSLNVASQHCIHTRLIASSQHNTLRVRRASLWQELHIYKWKNHFYEMKGDVGMSVHEKERKQEDAYTKTQTHS